MDALIVNGFQMQFPFGKRFLAVLPQPNNHRSCYCLGPFAMSVK